MNVLVTGANGHIGNHVVRACIDAGHRPVAFVRHGSDRRALSGLEVEVREGDILDADSVASAATGAEVVIHVAAPHRNFDVDESKILRPAVEGTRNVMEASKRAGVRRVVLCSSGATIGFATDPARPLDESAPFPEAKFLYSRAKIEAEKAAIEAARGGAIELVTVHPSGVFGPRDYRLTPATRGLIGLLQGDPSMFALCLTDVRDVGTGHVLAATKGTNGGRYLLTGDLMTPPKLAELVSATCGIRPSTMLPPRFLLRWIAAAAVRKARRTGEDAAVTREAIDDVYGRHLAYDSKRSRTELGMQYRGAAEVLRDAARWLLFVDALKPKVAAKVRAALGERAAPDPDWVHA